MVESENRLKDHQLMVVVRQCTKLKGELWDAQSASFTWTSDDEIKILNSTPEKLKKIH